jgi:hypothetical protein
MQREEPHSSRVIPNVLESRAERTLSERSAVEGWMLVSLIELAS